MAEMKFQSPIAGQICLNNIRGHKAEKGVKPFQSPKSGQICLNSK